MCRKRDDTNKHESQASIVSSEECFYPTTKRRYESLTLFAKTPNSNTWLLSAHYKIGMMFGHGDI